MKSPLSFSYRTLGCAGLLLGLWVAIDFYRADYQRSTGTSQNPRLSAPPHLVSRTEPQYSPEALLARVNGSVEIAGKVTADGKPSEMIVIKSAGFGLDEAALEACRLWRFSPATKNGIPAKMGFRGTLAFRIPESGIPTASLQFDLPRDATRPILRQGTFSGLDLPAAITNVEFDVNQQGAVERINCNSSALAERLSLWRFTPATTKGKQLRVHARLVMIRLAS